MQVFFERFSIDFEKESSNIEGVLYYTTNSGVKKKLAHFSGMRFDLYKVDILMGNKNKQGFENKMEGLLTELKKGLNLDEDSHFQSYIDSGTTGYFSLVIEVLVELNLLVYTNNNLRYTSNVRGNLLLTRLGYNILKSRVKNYNYLQVKIIPLSVIQDTEKVLDMKFGKTQGKVAVALKLDSKVDEVYYTVQDIIHTYRNIT